MGVIGKVVDEASKQFVLLRPYMSSHHPLCSVYREDMFYVRGKWYCRGCLITYPTAMILFFLLLASRMYGLLAGTEWYIFFFVGVAIGALHFLRGCFQGSGLVMKSLEKVLLGTALSFLAFAVYEMPLPLGWKVWLLVVLFITYGLLGGWVRIRYMKKICSSCYFKGD